MSETRPAKMIWKDFRRKMTAQGLRKCGKGNETRSDSNEMMAGIEMWIAEGVSNRRTVGAMESVMVSRMSIAKY